MLRRSILANNMQIPALTLTLAFVFGATSTRAQSDSITSTQLVTKSVPQSQLNQPAGADRCSFCHPAEVRGYARSAMARALRRAGQEPDGNVTAHGTKVTIHSSPTGSWQSWENGGVKTEYRVDYVIGSGEHASGYLVEIGGHLFQSPVAYYRSRQSYDLAPGYENQADPDFTRPVTEECVLCHSGTALHVPGTLNQYRSPAFAAEAITCERCHGPSEKHLANPKAGTILNPAKLEPAARDSICEQCHLFGVARVANPRKKLSDFVPGKALEETFTIYRNVMPPGSPAGDFKVISHVEQLALSACARKSGGRLWCATCHDPHEKMPQDVRYYRTRCLSCHSTNFPTTHPAKDSDCLGCHMPRRDAKDGGHTAFTDHRIQRRPEVRPALPSSSDIAAWREPSLELQKRNLGIAYIDVGMQRHSSPFIVQGYRTLTSVQRQFADDSDLFKWIGEALLLAKQTSDAKLAFGRALQLDPDSALTEASAASPYIQEGDDASAIAHLERALTVDPLFLPAASTLMRLYEKQGKVTEAADLSSKIKTAMTGGSDAGQTKQTGSAIDSQKNAEEVFKNIQVLKGVPSVQLIPAMQFMASALGVECTFCHVESHFEEDDKKPKETARQMMRMTNTLNKESFEGHREVTCYSCHRGLRNPVGTPMVDGEMQVNLRRSTSDSVNLSASFSTASHLIDNYIQALGGVAAIGRITSRVERGNIAIAGKTVKTELFTQVPEKWALVRHLAEGDSVAAFDGHTGWISIPKRPTRSMESTEIEAARMDADPQFPLHIQEIFPELRVEYPETIRDRECNVLFGIRGDRLSAKFYFDRQSGLLVRVIRFVDSPLGLNPTQIDYADYRGVDGVQVPFQVTRSEPGSSFTIQFEEARQNVPIDAARFQMHHGPN